MKNLILLLLPLTVGAQQIPPQPMPIFLKQGFSSILEFEAPPVKVVLGDSQNFQVEKLEKSLVIKTLAPYATSNMFVYFKEGEPRLFVLSASEDAQPTYYKKFEPEVKPRPASQNTHKVLTKEVRGGVITALKFDKLKDYLTLDVLLNADSKEPLKPNWSWVRLTYNGRALSPMKLWAEREEVQKDSSVKARFIFAKPNLPRDLKGVMAVIPITGSLTPISLSLHGGGH